MSGTADVQDGARFCVVCGGACGVADGVSDGAAHATCRARLELEPPRFCRECGRRMVVQVTPVAWSARCSRHGETTSGR